MSVRVVRGSKTNSKVQSRVCAECCASVMDYEFISDIDLPFVFPFDERAEEIEPLEAVLNEEVGMVMEVSEELSKEPAEQPVDGRRHRSKVARVRVCSLLFFVFFFSS